MSRPALAPDRLCTRFSPSRPVRGEIEQPVLRPREACPAERRTRHVTLLKRLPVGNSMMVSFRNFPRIHLVGIGGIGILAARRSVVDAGYSVFRFGHQSRQPHGTLQNLVATIMKGTKPRIGIRRVVVTSSAIRTDNPEVVERTRENSGESRALKWLGGIDAP